MRRARAQHGLRTSARGARAGRQGHRASSGAAPAAASQPPPAPVPPRAPIRARAPAPAPVRMPRAGELAAILLFKKARRSSALRGRTTGKGFSSPRNGSLSWFASPD